MTEGIKTLIYVGVALVVSAAAFFSRPKVEEFDAGEYVGKVLFEKFDDPAEAGRMKVVRYDEELGETKESFEIARDKSTGAWTIPSHGGYPADAENRMRDAALLLVDLEVLAVPSEDEGDHSMYGVIEPDKDKLEASDEGVGLLISFEDKAGDDLAGLIIGKEVKEQPGLRFVRVRGQDAVYVVEIDPEQLSTKFEDWIEKDLLQMSAWDVEHVTVENYTVSQQSLRSVSIDPEFDVSAKFEDNQWELQELKEYVRTETGVDTKLVTLAENEELNGDALNDLKNAVDQLEIIDVRPKPEGLGADLKAGAGFAEDEDGLRDLQKRGFYVVGPEGGPYDVLSANGDIYVGMKDGYEYVLRFGNTLATDDEDQEGESRYLFVMARVDEDQFPMPELEVVPELPGENSAEATPTEPEGDASTEEAGTEEAGTEEADAEEAATEEASATDAEEGEEAASDAGDDQEAKEAEIRKEIERITKENQRKLDERKEKLDKAEEKVADLNIRFADWYYVVSEEQFQKMQLERDELIKVKESDESAGDSAGDSTVDMPTPDQPEEPGDDIDAFRELQEQGLESDDQ